MGQASMALVDDREHLDLPDWDESTEVAILTQTTLSVDDTRRSVESIQRRFSKVIVRNDLCYATTNRQDAVKELCKQAEVVLVVGAPNSSNCTRLREVAETQGRSAYMIGGPEELDPAWLAGVESVGITSGASTPEILVQRVLEVLRIDEVMNVQSTEYELPADLEAAIAAFVSYYNYRRYHKALGNVRPSDVLKARRQDILQRRKEVKAQTIEKRRRYNRALRELTRPPYSP